MDSDDVIKKQPNGVTTNADEISYVDSDTHARAFCCCIHGWKSGPDPRWYYPWDKGIYRLLGVCCMWYCLCTFAPCVLCNKTARDIVCCEGQCTEGRKPGHTDGHLDGKDEIAEA